MRKGEIFQRIKISSKEYKILEKAEIEIKTAKALKRIQAFKFIYSGWKYNKIAKFLNITNDTITDWIDLYRREGVKGLIELKYKGRIPMLNEEQLSILRSNNESFSNSKEARKFIKKEFNILFNANYVQELLKKKFVYPLKRQD